VSKFFRIEKNNDNNRPMPNNNQNFVAPPNMNGNQNNNSETFVYQSVP